MLFRFVALLFLTMMTLFASKTTALGVLCAARQSYAMTSLASTTLLRMNSNSASSSSSEMDFAKNEIAGNKVVVFSKSYCPFCSATKALLDDMKVDYKLYELDQMSNGGNIQMALQELTGQRTVPNTFINGNHVGGNDNLQQASKSGKLQELLQQ